MLKKETLKSVMRKSDVLDALVECCTGTSLRGRKILFCIELKRVVMNMTSLQQVACHTCVRDVVFGLSCLFYWLFVVGVKCCGKDKKRDRDVIAVIGHDIPVAFFICYCTGTSQEMSAILSGLRDCASDCCCSAFSLFLSSV